MRTKIPKLYSRCSCCGARVPEKDLVMLKQIGKYTVEACPKCCNYKKDRSEK